MSSANVDLVRAAYVAFSKGDIPAVVAAMAPQIVWKEAESHPYAANNPYIGPDAIVKGVFTRLGGEWETFSAKPEEFLDAGDKVVVLGRESGTFKATGKTMNSQFAHVFHIANGKIASFQQYTDTFATVKATQA